MRAVRCPSFSRRLRDPDLMRNLGDTFFVVGECVLEPEFGAGEGGLGGVEMVEQLLNCSIGSRVGERVDANFESSFVGVRDDVCIGSIEVT